ncbi:MAG TPA: regulatory protein RecX [Patescibacteria group bacterium]|nr:regulatory protein RecX [Patescibacteria group bacterium]
MTRQRETPAEARARRGAVDDPATVLNAAARLLEVRPRSIEEVRRRLCEAGYRAELVDGAIDRLADLGILDDEAFARAWVESRDRARPRGERALRAELRRRGVGEEVISATLGEREPAPTAGRGALVGMASETADGVAAAALLARRGGAAAREPDPRKRRARAYALLARNGFDPDVAARAVTAWLAGEVLRPGE